MANPPARKAALLPLLALLPALAVGPVQAQDYALECDVVAGIATLRLTGPASVGVRSYAADARTWVIEVDVPRLPGLGAGSRSCVSATSVRVIPGELLGSPRSRIVVRHAGEPPRTHSAPGRHRLSWLPEAATSRREAPPVAPAGRRAPESPAARDSRRAEEARAAAEREAAEREAAERRRVREADERERLRQEAERREAARREAARESARREAQARRSAASAAEKVPGRRRVVVERPAEPVRAPVSLPPGYAAFGGPARLVVTVPTVVKDGPGRRYRTLRRLGAGERVTVQGRAGDWYLLDDGTGWAFATYLESPDEAAAAAASYLGVVQDVTVPVHEGPGGQHAVVAELYRGQQVVIDELNGEWAHVRNGGWVRRSALGNLEPEGE